MVDLDYGDEVFDEKAVSMVGKIRIIHFTIANTAGGVTKSVLELWKYIDKEKFHFDFVTMSDKLDFANKLEKEGCNIYYLSAYAEEDLTLFTREVREIFTNGYDVVQLQTSWWRGFVVEEIAKEMNIPKVIIYGNNTDVHIRENQSREEARKLHFRYREVLSENIATDFAACSEEAAQWLYGDRIPKEKIKIIPYGVALEQYRYDADVRKRYRAELGIGNEYVVGHVGRFAYQKNHGFLIEVFREIVREDSHVRLLLVGIGELEDKIKAKIREYNLENKVIYTGKRDDVGGLMQAMDIFAFPSRFEGFGIVLIEAQASGLKCIVSKKIPEKARITDNIEFLELDKKIWADSILKYKNGYAREDMYSIMEQKGWGMKTYAETFEKMYENGKA